MSDFEKFQDITLFQAVSASMANKVPQINSPITKNINRIKYKLCGP